MLVQKQYEESKKILIQTNFQTFAWAWFTVNTRGVYFSDGHDNLALAPYLDMFNHNANVQVEIEIKDDKYYLVKSLQNWPKNGQVFINYGPHDNTKLYVEYGFVLQDHPYDSVPLSLKDILDFKPYNEDDECFDEKIQFIHDHHLADNLKIFGDDELVSWPVLACLHILDEPNFHQLKSKVFEKEL